MDICYRSKLQFVRDPLELTNRGNWDINELLIAAQRKYKNPSVCICFRVHTRNSGGRNVKIFLFSPVVCVLLLTLLCNILSLRLETMFIITILTYLAVHCNSNMQVIGMRVCILLVDRPGWARSARVTCVT